MGVLSSPRALLLLLLIGVDASRRGAFATQAEDGLAPLEASGLAEEVGAEQHDGGVEGEPLIHSTGTLAKIPALQLLPKAIATLVVLAVAGAAAYYGLKYKGAGISYPRVPKEDLAKHLRAFLDSGKKTTQFINDETEVVVALTAYWDLTKPSLSFNALEEADKNEFVSILVSELEKATSEAKAQTNKDTGGQFWNETFDLKSPKVTRPFCVIAQDLADVEAGHGIGPFSNEVDEEDEDNEDDGR